MQKPLDWTGIRILGPVLGWKVQGVGLARTWQEALNNESFPASPQDQERNNRRFYGCVPFSLVVSLVLFFVGLAVSKNKKQSTPCRTAPERNGSNGL